MHLIQSLLSWAERPTVLVPLIVGSVVLFAASIVGVPWYLRRLPADYFSRRERKTLGFSARPRSLARTLLAVVRNVFAVVLIVAGLLMLVLPGQGVLTIVTGVLLLDFPGKRRLERWILSRKPVLRAVNALRRRAGQPPLLLSP